MAHTKTQLLSLWMLTLLSLALVITRVVVAEHTCDQNPRSDGCSMPKWIKTVHKDDFKASCNRHDFCYHCMTHFGLTRYQCDQRFRRNMLNKCHSLTAKHNLFVRFWKRLGCYTEASVYFIAVRIWGGRPAPPLHSICRQRWVQPCIQ